jgi:hypothetical protein
MPDNLGALGQRGLNVKGFTNVQRALKNVEKDVRLGMNKELRAFAEPVRSTAENLAATRIRNQTPQWAEMRVGVTTKLVYVVPKQRGVRAGKRKRKKFGTLMLDRAMEPALDQHAPDLERDFNEMLYRVAAKFNRSG